MARCCGRSKCAPGRFLLQRTFSTFPGALPGAGLLLLRCALATILIGQGYLCLLGWNQSGWPVRALGFSGIAAGILLLIGYLTPLASGVGALICALSEFSQFGIHSHNAFSDQLQVALGILICIAMLCLGPGAFSIDSRLFGRREIIIPDASHPPRQPPDSK
jgi:uncharacterized membrane protein YphA (DoxX/SURF4 family)